MSILERVYFFHQQLKNNRYPNAKDLVEEFELSLPTARRDIAYLRDRLLAPLEFDRKKNGFYYTTDDFALPFEESPKILFLLGLLGKIGEEAGLGGLDEIRSLEHRLGSMLTPEYRRLIDAIHCQWIEVESFDKKVFQAVVESVARSMQLEISYRSSRGRESVRTIEVLQLVNYQGRWYLLAYCSLRHDFRLFHMARISRAEVLTNPAEKSIADCPNTMDQAFGIFQGEPLYTAEILFSSTAAELVRRQYWHKDQEISESDQGVILRLPVSDDREIMMKILQYGSMVRVLGPEELRQKIIAEISNMGKRYQIPS
ncbi:MAG: WYL domain-containing protein [Thermodesulfobacteriota bacterium]